MLCSATWRCARRGAHWAWNCLNNALAQIIVCRCLFLLKMATTCTPLRVHLCGSPSHVERCGMMRYGVSHRHAARCCIVRYAFVITHLSVPYLRIGWYQVTKARHDAQIRAHACIPACVGARACAAPRSYLIIPC